MAIAYEALTEFITLFLTVAVLAVIVYSIRGFRLMEEWERRILIVVLFFAIHEMSFFLGEAFIYQLTNMLFVVALLYALAYVFSFEKKLTEMEEQRKELLSYMEEIRDIKEIKKKLGLK
ncbi:MAG: hypothetical protein D6733_05015 [Methanobacteriota archaeon]|nr:MAG: hypothetical protein D6733_05015 [Euryarchaeota archaeon]